MNCKKIIHSFNELVTALSLAVYTPPVRGRTKQPTMQQLLQMKPQRDMRVAVWFPSFTKKPGFESIHRSHSKEFLWDIETTMAETIEIINHQNKFPFTVSLS